MPSAEPALCRFMVASSTLMNHSSQVQYLCNAFVEVGADLEDITGRNSAPSRCSNNKHTARLSVLASCVPEAVSYT